MLDAGFAGLASGCRLRDVGFGMLDLPCKMLKLLVILAPRAEARGSRLGDRPHKVPPSGGD